MTFCSIGSHVNENEKKNPKNFKIENFEKQKTNKKKKKWSGDIVERGLPTKFCLQRFSEKPEFTDDRRLRHDSSGDKVKQR